MKKDGVSFLVQGITLTIFFALYYILKASLYYYSVGTAHAEYGELMMIKINVFIPEYWAHLTPRYILPITLITIVGASFSCFLWDRKCFALGHIVLFLCWPKMEMSSVELVFTASFSFSMLLLSLITPAFCTALIERLRQKENKAAVIPSPKSKVLNS